MFFLKKILGDPNKRVIKKLEPLVEQINSLEEKYSSYSQEQLKEKTNEFKERVQKAKDEKEEKEILDIILPDAFAIVREAAKRTLKQRHFDCQLIGGIVLHRGEIAEMKTGEGKTLTATLPIYLNALTGKGVHVITVNDYLSKRDMTWMGQVYNYLGLSVGCIVHEQAYLYTEKKEDSEEEKHDAGVDPAHEHLQPVPRKQAYQADILYGTNNEFGFDYLRDNMAQNLGQMVQRDLNYVIIDEIDSILIDEARTPLIISAPMQEPTKKYYQFAQLVARLKEGEDYTIDEKMKVATLTEEGINKMEKWLGVKNIYTEGGVRDVHHIEQALRAHTLFKKDRDYVVKDGEVVIVDEFTGRLMFGRRYSEGLHQAIEAKEGLEIKQESLTLATITFQNYFRLYKKLAGMTGTAMTEAEEFYKIYNLEVVEIPTNKPIIKVDLPDRVYKTERGKFKAVVREIKERHEKGQPILVGTVSIEKNELLGEMLKREGIKCALLNAKNHEKEAKIIANAGKPGAVTVATNMAGRGVDIILGGTKSSFPSEEEWQKSHQKVVEAGGLHIIGTERHEARRIDNQLRGRAGRQGDPGSSQFFVSMEDDLMRIFGGDKMKRIMERLNFPEDVPIENKIISRSIEQAQKKVEGNNFDIRKHLVEYDDVLNKHREVIYKKRRKILEDYEKAKQNPQENKIKEEILKMLRQEIEQTVIFHTAEESTSKWDLNKIYKAIQAIFPLASEEKISWEEMPEIKEKSGNAKTDDRTKIINYLFSLAQKRYQDIEQQFSSQGLNFFEVEKEIILRAIDTLWIEHLEAIDYLRTGIGLRGYGQIDPLIEYKKEAYRLFTELMNLIQKQVVYNIFKVGIVENFSPTVMDNQQLQMTAPPKTGNSSSSWGSQAMEKEVERREQKDPFVRPVDKNGKKIGRNDPCPCGSGKKFKKCCGRNL